MENTPSAARQHVAREARGNALSVSSHALRTVIASESTPPSLSILFTAALNHACTSAVSRHSEVQFLFKAFEQNPCLNHLGAVHPVGQICMISELQVLR